MLSSTNSQVWVTGEEDAIHVPYLPLIPVGTTKDRDSTRYRICFSGVCLYADPTSVFDAKQVVYNLEAFLSLGEIHRGDINGTLELTLGVVSQECENWNYCRGRDVKDELILED